MLPSITSGECLVALYNSTERAVGALPLNVFITAFKLTTMYNFTLTAHMIGYERVHEVFMVIYNSAVYATTLIEGSGKHQTTNSAVNVCQTWQTYWRSFGMWIAIKTW